MRAIGLDGCFPDRGVAVFDAGASDEPGDINAPEFA
ncbi:hypothetical protein X566_06700 [Afipia sp. P52-10]|nr:hypothetical protein X566_06700 [Afipia sp. P52-10]